MARKTTMAEPAKHVPAQTPARHTDRQFGFGAEGVPPTLARGLRTAHEAVDHLRRPLQRPEMVIAVVAHVHAAFTDWHARSATSKSIRFNTVPAGQRYAMVVPSWFSSRSMCNAKGP